MPALVCLPCCAADALLCLPLCACPAVLLTPCCAYPCVLQQLEHDMQARLASARGLEALKQPSSSGSSSMAPPSPLCARHGSTAAYSEGDSTLPPDSTGGQHLTVDTGSSNTDSGAHSSAAAPAPPLQRAWASALRVSMTALIEYCDKGCLQDALDIGWLREDRWGAGAGVCGAGQRQQCELVAHSRMASLWHCCAGLWLPAAEAGGGLHRWVMT